MVDELCDPGGWLGDCTICNPPKQTPAAESITRLIVLKGCGLKEAAEVAGLHPQHLARILEGRAALYPDNIMELCPYFGCLPNELLGMGGSNT